MTKTGNCWIRSTQRLVSGQKHGAGVWLLWGKYTLVAYNPSSIGLKQTKNPLLHELTFSRQTKFVRGLLQRGGYVQQVNSGGLNVKFVVYCSMDKFICENLPLFQYALLNRTGVDTMKERITTRAEQTQTSILTADRAKELMQVFNDDHCGPRLIWRQRVSKWAKTRFVLCVRIQWDQDHTYHEAKRRRQGLF